MAVGHTILLLAYQILTHRVPYDDLLPSSRTVPRPPSPTHLVHQLEALGFTVSLTPKEPAA